MEQIYHISGTHDEIQFILEKEFDLSAEAARIAAAMLIVDQNKEQDQVQLEEDTFWHLNREKSEYQSHIFSTRYTISFSKAMLEVFDELLVPGILAVCGFEKFAAFSEVMYCIKAFVKNFRRIKDSECCVYFQTLQYLKTHNNRWFSVDQATPCLEEDAVCVHLDRKWECRFRSGERKENCNICNSDVKDILDTFCADSVMEKNEDGTLYQYKI